jgi:hypothetical protein
MDDPKYSLSFRILHPVMSPKLVSAELGLEPQRAWEAGTPRTSPRGTPLTGTHQSSYWSYKYDNVAGKTLAAAVRDLASNLMPHRTFIRSVSDKGGRSEIFVGWFGDGNTGEIFDFKILTMLADMKIDLALDVYHSSMKQGPHQGQSDSCTSVP